MSSKAAALATLTNHGGKRKADGAAADGDDAATAKKKFKLKSHNRVSYAKFQLVHVKCELWYTYL